MVISIESTRLPPTYRLYIPITESDFIAYKFTISINFKYQIEWISTIYREKEKIIIAIIIILWINIFWLLLIPFAITHSICRNKYNQIE